MLKLCDYGLARHVSNPKDLTQYVSTRWYRAPEILLRLKSYSFAIDIWAFASVAVEISTYRPLFAGLNETDQLWQILKELGHPSLLDRDDEDLGGDWDEGIALAESLGFLFPCIQPNSIFNIIDRTKKDLACLVRKCLMWDPLKRPTATQLSTMSYFKNTAVHFEIVGPSFSHLTVHSTDDTFERPVNSPLSVSPLSKTSLTPAATTHRRSKNELLAFDAYSDPSYLYTKWDKSSSGAEVSCGDSYSPVSITFNMPEDIEDAANESVNKNSSMGRFDSQADTSVMSHRILC